MWCGWGGTPGVLSRQTLSIDLKKKLRQKGEKDPPVEFFGLPLTFNHPGVILQKDATYLPKPGSIWGKLRSLASERMARVLFVEAEDPRVLSAAMFLRDRKIGRPLLVGNTDRIAAAAQKYAMEVKGFEVLDPDTHGQRERFRRALFERRKAKGLTEEQAERLIV
jgi:hypothetical protein